jgi:regulator of sigma E protease
VLRLNGSPVDSFTDISQYVMTRAGQPIAVDGDARRIRSLTLQVTPDRQMRPDGLGGERAMGFLGIGLAEETAEVSGGAAASVDGAGAWRATHRRNRRA